MAGKRVAFIIPVKVHPGCLHCNPEKKNHLA